MMFKGEARKSMRRIWKDEDITKALKNMAKTSTEEAVFERAWFKIEDKLTARKKHVWDHFVWRPLGHPVRWVALAACLCLSLTGIFYYQNSVEQTEMASYLISVSNPTANVTREQLGFVKVPVLLTEPSVSVPDIKVGEHLAPIAADEELL